MFKKVPHTYVIIFSLIVIAAIATWFVPAGEFQRQEVQTESGKIVNQIVPGSYERVDQNPQTWRLCLHFLKDFKRLLGLLLSF